MVVLSPIDTAATELGSARLSSSGVDAQARFDRGGSHLRVLHRLVAIVAARMAITDASAADPREEMM